MPRCAAIWMPDLHQENFRPSSVRNMPGRQFTTAKTIEAEHEIVRRVREGQNQIEPVLHAPAGNHLCRPAPASQPRPEERS